MVSFQKLSPQESGWFRTKLGIKYFKYKIAASKRQSLNLTLGQIYEKARPYALPAAAILAGALTGAPVVGMIQTMLPNVEFELKGVPVTDKILIGTALVIDHEKNGSERRFANLENEASARGLPVEDVIREKQDLAVRVLENVERSFTDNMEKMDEIEGEALTGIKTRLLSVIEKEKVDIRGAINQLMESLASQEGGGSKGLDFIQRILLQSLANKLLRAVEIEAQIDKIQAEDRIAFVAEDLELSDVWLIEDRRIRGIIREKGNPGDHVSDFIARHERAGLVNVPNATQLITTGAKVIIDGLTGKLIINPSEQTVKAYQRKIEDIKSIKTALKELRKLKEIETLDGRTIELSSEIEKAEDVETLEKHGINTLGIVRTEVFFAKDGHGPRKEEPSIEEQIQNNRGIVAAAKGKVVSFRTIDTSGEKYLPYFVGKEPPDSTGVAYLTRPAGLHNLAFQSQLIALFHTGGNIRILFPSIRSHKDFLLAMSYVDAVCLMLYGIEHSEQSPQIKFGIMIENQQVLKDLPRLAADDRLGFFVVGPKDLTQSVTHFSRLDPETARYIDHLHPEVVKALKKVITNAGDKDVCVCRGIRDEWEWFLVLIGLGYRTISVSTDFVDVARKLILGVDAKSLEEMVKDIDQIKDAKEVRRHIRRFMQAKILSGEWAGLKEIELLLFPEGYLT